MVTAAIAFRGPSGLPDAGLTGDNPQAILVAPQHTTFSLLHTWKITYLPSYFLNFLVLPRF